MNLTSTLSQKLTISVSNAVNVKNYLSLVIKKSKFIFLTVFLSMSFLVSCKKESSELSTFNNANLKTPDNIKDIFKSLNANDLWTIIENQHSEKAELMLSKTANKLSAYFLEKEGIDVKKEFEGNNNLVILFGLIRAKQEQQRLQTNNSASSSTSIRYSKPPSLTSRSVVTNKILPLYPTNDDDLGCFMTAVNTFIGVLDLKAVWASIAAGASPRTILALVKLVGKRVGFAINAVFTVYNVGNCMGWWNIEPSKTKVLTIDKFKHIKFPLN